MDALADSLENLDVDGGSTAIVAVVLVRIAVDGAVRALGSKGQGCRPCYAWHDVADVEGKDGGVCVDIIWIKDLWEHERLQNGCGKIARKRIFVRTVAKVRGG